MRCRPLFLNRGMLVVIILTACATAFGQNSNSIARQLDELRQQNQALESQLQQQQRMIDQLTRQFSNLQKTNQQQQSDYQQLKASVGEPEPPKKSPLSIGNVIISGEGGVGFFASQSDGPNPHADLKVDEARLFLDAPLLDDVFFYGEVDLQTREEEDEGVYLGELYLEFENLSKYWGADDLVNFRIGQMYTPFGEEYQYRFAFDNPLISHSLSDVWALEGGAEFYGSWKKWSYALAVQSGDLDLLHDQTDDKTIVGRIGFDPTAHLHLSLSGERTGTLNAVTDPVSGTWFGGSFFMPIGSSNTTTYNVNMGEADARYSWKGGHAAAAAGYAGYSDNDPRGNNHRDIYYYYLEGMQNFWRKLYGAARFSQILTPKGYPIMGDSAEFGIPTDETWRLSLGLGYAFNSHLTLKTEYTFEHAFLHDGGERDHVNLFALEAAFKF
ncbi:MAG TPA: hypothetical protein VMR33_07215 [Candidatus Baltobacteraceae bacterium]|nr:hypothetical protein [Candidatus Baltobacteraceae bacterium]